MSEETVNSHNTNNSIEIISQIATMMKNTDVVLSTKLDGHNYTLWSRLMRVAIHSRKKSRFITGNPPPPRPSDPDYPEWEEDDLTVFSWIIQNMDNKLVSNFAQHQSSQALWRSLSVAYGGRTDPFQISDLEVKANKVTQGALSLEEYWNALQGIWVNIDRRQTDPISCCKEGINQYRELIETKRLYQFLAGMNNELDGVRRGILKEEPAPSVEGAYARAKFEATRLGILNPATLAGDGPNQ